MRVSVLGAGNGGQALAGDLARKGVDVVLYEHPDFSGTIRSIKERGSSISLHDKIEGVGTLVSATCSMEEAVAHGECLFFVLPSFAQEPFLDLAIPFLRPGQTLVFIPGNFGTLVARKKLRAAGKEDGISLVETDTLPYACRTIESGVVSVWGLKEYLWIGSLPASGTMDAIMALKPIFPIRMVPMVNALNVGFANTNMILHCPTMIMNAGRIETDERRFQFYTQGMSESVCKVMEAMDRERIRVGERFGLNLISEFEDASSNYAMKEKLGSLYEVLHNSPVYGGHGVDSPQSMTHRYISEDVPYLLVPVSRLGELAGIETPLIDSIIRLAEVVNGVSYRNEGRSLSDMGIEGMNVEEIREFIA